MSSDSPNGWGSSPTSGSDAATIDLTSKWPTLAAYCPHPASVPQALFLLTEQEEVFYGGAAGGGKSDALLMGALQYVDQPGYSALLLRRTYPELTKSVDGLIPRSHDWLHGTDAHWSGEHRRWTFPSGAMIEFGHCRDEDDKRNYQSAAYQYVAFDELTSFTHSIYEFIGFTRSRRTKALEHIPIRVRSASNPGNVGHAWVKDRFVEHRKPGVVYIPARVWDNPGLDVDKYVASMTGISEVLKAQMLEGDWGVFEGAAYPEFREEIHVVPEFPVPAEWERFEFMDHGATSPTAWYVAATDFDGNIVIFDEYYDPGLVSKHAEEILERRKAWYPVDTDHLGRTVEHRIVTIADPSVRNSSGMSRDRGSTWGDPATIQTEYEAHGIRLELGNNDRAAGRLRVAELLTVRPGRVPPYFARNLDGAAGAPQLYIVGRRCPRLVEQLPTAPLLPIDAGVRGAGEIVHPDWETQYGHACAALRYGMMSRPRPTEQRPMPIEDPRLAYLAKVTAQLEDDDGGRTELVGGDPDSFWN